jgi:hypothetical protein
LAYNQVVASERVTVTLPPNLLDEIDRLERNRSRFIVEAVEHELERRRRAALRASIASPHPETAELAGVALDDWGRDLPEENDLVDPAAGTAVRWVEGRGWVTEAV